MGNVASSWAVVWKVLLLAAALAGAGTGRGAETESVAAPLELEQVQSMFVQGQYGECIAAAAQAIAEGEYEEDWRLVLTESYLATGQYASAHQVVTNALRRYSTSIRLRLLAREVFLYNGDGDEAASMLNQINYLGGNRMWAYRDPPNLVALGRAAVLLGADPRRVLEQFYDRAKERDPDLREVYLASGQLALDKNDYQLASTVFAQGLEKLPEDPDLHFGLARAFAPSDRLQMLQSLDATLTLNSNHVPSHLLLADHYVDGEEYDKARESLDVVLGVNPWHPKAWAYRAVIAHLRVEPEREREARANALRFWTNNPAVDHLIGLKLSQKYRFAEGADYQRRALVFDRDFLPAKMQLAQDLLRLGEDDEGWALVHRVHEEDRYDVTAFNLVTLRDNMETFATLTNRDFILRMGAHEAKIYGEEALALLQRAKDELCRKYEFELERPTVVEIFPDQKDFGVRTFGMPSNPGFLGVCFGPVITANSPASQGANPNNWQAVLWHEFCHVITLGMTRNKMPRWLSEGISVYEELQANSAWGQIMNPRYREMIMEGEATRLGDLSSAFMAPKSDTHLQFAYYESYLAVDFIIGRFGRPSLVAILRDLGEGMEINEAIAKHTAPLEELENDFDMFVIQKAEALGPELDWERPDEDAFEAFKPDWVLEHSKNYYVLRQRGQRLLEEERWEEAKEPLQTLIELYPDQIGPGNAYELLAWAHRELGETDREQAMLKRWANQDADALDAYEGLMELGAAEEDWSAVMRNAERFLAVNPLVPMPHRFLARAAENLGRSEEAIRAYEKLLLLDDRDPAEIHYRLAKLKFQTGRPDARRHVLKALEEAPRFRDAHRLLLRIQRSDPST